MNNFLILFPFGYCTFCRSLDDSVLLCNRNEGRRKVRSVPTTCWPVGMERKETRLLPQLAVVVVVHGVAFWCGRWNTFSPTPPEKTMTKRIIRKKKKLFSILLAQRARAFYSHACGWKKKRAKSSCPRRRSRPVTHFSMGVKKKKFLSSYFTRHISRNAQVAAMIPKGSINITVIWYFLASHLLLCHCLRLYVHIEDTLRADKPVWSFSSLFLNLTTYWMTGNHHSAWMFLRFCP